MTITIPLTRGYFATVDDEDADLLQYKWMALVPNRGFVYAVRFVYPPASKKQCVYLHRLIVERMMMRTLARHEMVDHIDGNGLLCVRSNLRLATNQENSRNRRANISRSDGLKGVSFDGRRNAWRAYISIDGKQKWLGYYRELDDARAAYCAAAIEYFGEFAHSGTRPLRLADAPIATRQLPLFDMEAA